MATEYYNGKKISGDHYVIFKAYEKKYGVAVQLNQGRRSLADQWRFWNLYKSGRGNLAAYPSPAAPHIKWGRNFHANDINAGTGKGQAQHVAQFYRSLGIPVAFNVPGESWHMDTLDSGALRRAADKIRRANRGPRTLKFGSRGEAVQELQKDLRAVGRWSGKTGKTFGPRTRTFLKSYQHSQGLKQDGVYGPNTRKHLEADAKRARAGR